MHFVTKILACDMLIDRYIKGQFFVLMKLCENSVLFSKTKSQVSTLFFIKKKKKKKKKKKFISLNYNLVCIAIFIFLHGVLLGAAVCIFSEF